MGFRGGHGGWEKVAEWEVCDGQVSKEDGNAKAGRRHCCSPAGYLRWERRAGEGGRVSPGRKGAVGLKERRPEEGREMGSKWGIGLYSDEKRVFGLLAGIWQASGFGKGGRAERGT